MAKIEQGEPAEVAKSLQFCASEVNRFPAREQIRSVQMFAYESAVALGINALSFKVKIHPTVLAYKIIGTYDKNIKHRLAH